MKVGYILWCPIIITTAPSIHSQCVWINYSVDLLWESVGLCLLSHLDLWYLIDFSYHCFANIVYVLVLCPHFVTYYFPFSFSLLFVCLYHHHPNQKKYINLYVNLSLKQIKQNKTQLKWTFQSNKTLLLLQPNPPIRALCSTSGCQVL